ncbi:transformation/transcription domain-associated protein [Pogonomyrmex barbatus]|uniref:Transformation/transcription domain-associated protein n=1 Tax=Pogonomyrmex barbatus TaxID=144034 RepID=A0A6I9WD63_9HYME|nr:transformation/transcription domain-associated protein [Pogonomyrmex barbatus]XP_025074074.1 transformation/transcription domain-associated protein [Pogonomyrmex barbatus]XP_025074075.1 transformation/transcription domain-associated protein [Pogonomyrmex barbatus]
MASNPMAQMNTYLSYVTMLADPVSKDELKLKAAQELSENFEIIMCSSQYSTFLDHMMKIFLKILQEGEPHFISEYNIQQVRKLILEMIHRLPSNEYLRPYVRQILTLTFKLLETDNEENVLVCLRIIIDLHKQYKPIFNPDIQYFLQFVKSVYSELPKNLSKIFEPRSPLRVKDLSEINIEALLKETFTITAIQSEKKAADGTVVTYNLIPKAVLSLKVLQELPIIVVLLNQLYKQNVHQEVSNFVPIVITTISLQPSPQHRASPGFNKEVFVDFMGAQVKTLSFLAYVIRSYQDLISQNSTMLVKGILGLFTLCPMEVAHLRKELVIASRHILATDLRNHFIPHMEIFFNEDIFIGHGWTAHEVLRPLAYSTLADLVHHVRLQLPLSDVSRAVHLYGKNLLDQTLPTAVQMVSCKLLMNLVDTVRQRSDAENSNQGRELLMRILLVFVLKFKTIAKIYIPILRNKTKQLRPTITDNTAEDTKPCIDVNEEKEPPKSKFGFPTSQAMSYNVADYRNLVKSLVHGAKAITSNCINRTSEVTQSNQLQPKETLIYIQLVKWALPALDIFTIGPPTVGVPAQPGRPAQSQTIRTREEKEVLDLFGNVFTQMNPQTFQEIFSVSIDYMVERIFKNCALQIIGSAFLSSHTISSTFATILVEYLLERMSEMGSNVERSNLYLKLFKLVFGSVSLFPAENEHMLRPHLNLIVNRAMELAMSAKEPYNYFLLLRALFRSIGGGSHDLLYQEFLPLLPNMLEGLNRLQSGLHRQHMKDLFVELCLTVPVRLSSLLPYLPMLMDPLVSALNGSYCLVSQGLRTLELCVDNLQPDFLYEHIQPIRAELMQALWRTLHNSNDQAHVAFRVLGKFGGGNRRMMIEPQKLEYNDRETNSPNVVVYFQGLSQSIDFPMEKVIEAAFNALKASTTDLFYRKQCWEIIYCYLAASLKMDDAAYLWYDLFTHSSFKESEISPQQGSHYRCPDAVARNVQQIALTGMFVAAEIKELRPSVLETVVSIVRHYTMIAIAQQAGLFSWTEREIRKDIQGQDPLVLIDALAVIMAHDERELYKVGYLALMLILETATNILGSKERACQLPFMEYLAERMCSLCYERAWYAKLGGCIAIKFLFERMATKWVLNHLFMFLKALIFVMMDLTDEVSNGAIDMAKENLRKMLRVCVNPGIQEGNMELREAQSKSLYEVTRELVKQVTSPHTIVREQAMTSLRQLAEIQNKSVAKVMEPHKEVLAEMIPPKKHLLRHQSTNAQIGLMDGNTFCAALNPQLFTIDSNTQEHKVFFQDLVNICEADEANLNKVACYKSVTNLTPLRKSALRALVIYHCAVGWREKILQVLYKTLERSNAELQETAFECMKTFISGFQLDMESVHSMMRPMLLTLGDHRNLSLNCVRRLSYLTQLFPSTFSVTLCEQMLQHVKKFLENLIQSHKGISKSGENEQKITIIIGIYHNIPASLPKFNDALCRLILQTEKSLLVEVSSPFREPLMKCLLRYPTDALNLFLHDSNIKDQQWSRYLEYLISHKDGKPFRDILHNSTARLVTMLLAHSQTNSNLTHMEKSEVQYRAIKIIGILIKYDEQWFSTQSQLVGALKQIWYNDDYQALHKKVEGVEYCHWKEPKHIVKILLHYFRHQPNDIDLLFQLLRATCDRFVPDFQFLRDFLENTVAQEYTVEWKRSAFFRFVEHFPTNNMSQELKANVLQLIIIPCFAISFERGEGTKLVGGAPMPYKDDQAENVVSVFISKIIDPDNPFGSADCVRISLLQFSCLLVEQASQHIHDVTNKKQGNKLRRLMTFAWPCLLGKNCVDPTTRYHGHLLLSHIIAKFAIHKRIVLQVFHSLLKAHAVDARNVVRQALEILTPAMPVRMEDGNTMLTHWTKKIIVEEGHSMQQLSHILQLVVRHYKVYYPVRHHLVQHIVNSIQRIGCTQTATVEHRRLALELAEVIVKWELYRIKEEAEATESKTIVQPSGIKRTLIEDPSGKRMSSQITPPSNSPVPLILPRLEPGSTKPIERSHSDAVLNFLLRLACQANDVTTIHGNPGEQISRRCVALLKMALKPDVWIAEQCDLKLAWLDKVLASVDNTQPNYANISTALEVLTFLLGVMKREQILVSFKPLQRGISACIASSNTKIIRLVHALLSRLMTIFPAEQTSTNVASKYEELDTLYSTVGRFIAEGLTTYEKTSTAMPSSLFGTLMMLKAACTNNPSYIDRLITPFMRVLHRMTKEHLHPTQTESNPVTNELLILSLDLVKNRVAVMSVDMRKSFIGTILVGLIEKTQDVKVMKAITKILEEWMKNKSTIAINQAPSLREKSILLVKMMQYVEKRFPEDLELNRQFLELVNYVYRDESLKVTELACKLEQAFLAGLRCVQPQVRAKFFEVFDNSMKRRLVDRILYIVVSQNWENIGPHYWIKQCIELLLATVNPATMVQMTNEDLLLPSISSIMQGGMEKDSKDQTHFVCRLDRADEVQSHDTEAEGDLKETVLEVDAWMSNLMNSPDFTSAIVVADEITEKPSLTQMIRKQIHFMENAKKIRTEQLLLATAQLCHLDTGLAERVWLDTFPRIWSNLEEPYLTAIMAEVPPFVASGAHVIQKDCHPSALGTFLESLAHCNPPVAIAPAVMKYLGRSHNVWHRITLSLEQMGVEMAADNNGGNAKNRSEPDVYRSPDETEQVECLSPYYEVMNMLSEMYSLLCEEDMWSGLWQKRPAHYKETLHAIALEQQGFFEQAQGAYEVCMTKFRQDFALTPAPYHLNMEMLLWEKHWERTVKEQNQWEILLELGGHNNYNNPFLVLESAWRIPNWSVMKEILAQLEQNCPREMLWKINLYRGFVTLCTNEDQHLSTVERYVEMASAMCMREWRRLPRIVSHVHQPLLQAAQQIMELQEAMQIHQGLLHGRNNSLHDMKAIVKTWRNRLPVIADDLSHWSDIFTWRQHHYSFISNHYDSQQDQTANHSLLGVHASMQAIIHFGKIARKQNLCGVCLDSLVKIYNSPTSVPMVDCFQKIRQQVKCYLQMATMGGQNELQEGLEVLESTNMGYFTKEMIAEFYALKGLLQSQLGRSDDANKSFSAAAQLHDTLVKAWSLWGDYLENIFIRDARQINIGINALVCFLHACRHQNESKSRKYIAKILWLLAYDDDKSSLIETVDKYAVGVPAIQWLPWVPQLLMCLIRHEGDGILNLLSQVGRMFPQAVYFSIRTIYLTLKIEQRERHKSGELTASKSQDGVEDRGSTTTSNVPQRGIPETGHTVRATIPMWRCSKIMHMQRDIHPTLLSSLEGIIDQMVWFRETWYEEVLRQLRQGLAKCYAIAFENRGAVSEATITPHTLNFVKKLVSTFGIGIENISSSQNMNNSFSSAASESLARRAQATVQDPVFQKMKGQFTSDFDFTVPGARLLHNLISKLKKWIKILEEKTKQLPKSFLIEEKCRFLSNFNLRTAEVELPGEYLIPRHSHYSVKIARFMPRVEVVQRHNTTARRLRIRGHNGRIYPYLVVNDAGLGDARREERLLQLLRMLNHYLTKQKETSRRFLHFTVPRLVAVSPHMRLVEDNPAAISLLDIYKQSCTKLGMEHDAPIARYYEKLAAVQARGAQASHQVLRDILKEVQTTMVPKTMLKDWAMKTFPGATDYWTFRKIFTLQLSLACFAEYVLHLTRLNPDMMYVHQDSGLINIAYFKFDIDDTSGELDANRPVPFRLTPNIFEFLTTIGVCGPLTASAIATARCLVQPTFQLHAILRAILRDEVIADHKRQEDAEGTSQAPTDPKGELLITMVTRAVTAIINRLNSLANFDGIDSKVSTLVAAANSHDNLCRMDPSWHPWM